MRYKIKELRKLPRRKWDDIKCYDSLMIIPSGLKHDSGWALIYIIGMKDDSLEIAAACDDICWKIPKAIAYDFRTDMYYPGGIVHVWSRDYQFQVGCSLSSTDVTLIEK